MRRFFVTFLLLSMAQICFAQAPVQSVSKVELNRYLGTWYELALIPQYFQRQCVKDTSATYANADDGMISVLNQCTTDSNARSKADGRARVVEAQSNAKLEVSFLKLFGAYRFWAGGDYWVIGLDEQYRWAVVGHPSRKYGWVLSRTPAVDAAQWGAIEAVLKTNGYDLCALELSPQTDGVVTRKPLCEREK